MSFLTRATVSALASLALLSAARAECSCCALPAPAPATTTAAPAAAAPAATAPVGHPLRGVIIEVLPEKSALLVAHEEIPGVMRAMTMLLKVNATDLAAAPKGATITATLVKKPDGWWLDSVTLANSAEK